MFKKILYYIFFITGLYANNVDIPSNKCALIVASSQYLYEIKDYIKNHIDDKRFLNVYVANNRRYAVSIGFLKDNEETPVMKRWKSIGKIPSDSFCAKSYKFIRELTPSEYKNNTNTNYSHDTNKQYSNGSSCTEIEQGYSYSNSLSKNSSKCYSYRINADRVPIFTLKQDSPSNADFDIRIYDYSDMSGLLGKGLNNGSETELVTLNYQGSYNYVYIKINNAGSGYGSYKLYTHQLDYAGKFAEALSFVTIKSGVEMLIGGMFGVNDNSSSTEKQNVSRGASFVMSSLAGKDLTNTSENLLINEMMIKAKQEFGYGFWGKVVAKFGVLVVQDIYRYN